MACEPASHIREGVSHASLYRLLKRGSVIARDATVFVYCGAPAILSAL